MAFELQFSIRSPASREVEAHWPADVVMSVFRFLDSKVLPHPLYPPYWGCSSHDWHVRVRMYDGLVITFVRVTVQYPQLTDAMV